MQVSSSAVRGPVLHFIDTTGPGGGETVFLQVANGLRKRGWPAHVVLVGPGWVLDRTRELHLPLDVLKTNGRFDVRFLAQLVRVVRKQRIRLIHAHLFSPAVYASAISAIVRIPVIATFHGASDIVPGNLSRMARYWLVNRHARIVCVSQSLMKQGEAVRQLRADRVHVVHNGIDIDAFRSAEGNAVRVELGATEDTFLVGAIGNVRAAKDYATLIRAAAVLASDRRLAFVIAGERTEPLFSSLCELRDQLGLRDRLSFLGFRDDAPALIRAFDTMVISSSTEGFSLAAVQAMAAGTPVVATRSGGPEEIITHEHDGLLVTPGDEHDIARAIMRMRNDSALRYRLVSNAGVTVNKRFSLQSMLDRYEEMYSALTRRD